MKLKPLLLVLIFLFVNLASAQTPEPAPTPIVLDVVWSPDGGMIATVDDSGTLNVTLSDQITPVFEFARPVRLIEAAVVWSPEGDHLAAGIGNRMYIWDAASWQLLHEFEVGLPSGFFTWGPTDNIPEGVQTITWSVDGRYVVVGTYSYETIVWDTEEARLIYREGDLSGGGPGRVWLGDDGWMGDGANKLNAFTGERVLPGPADRQHRFVANAEGGTTEPRPDNSQIAMGNDTGFVLIIDLNTLWGVKGFKVADWEPPVSRRRIVDLSWNGTWDFIAAVSHDGELYVVNLTTEEVTSILKVDGKLNAVDWNPQSNEIFYAGVSDSGQPILSIVDVGGIGGVPSAAPDPTPSLTQTAIPTPKLTPTSVLRGQRTAEADLNLRIDDAAWTPDGSRLAIAAANGIYLYSEDLRPITHIQGHDGTVTAVAWSPDGSQLASGGDYDDGTVRIWYYNPQNDDLTLAHTLTTDPDYYQVIKLLWKVDGTKLAVLGEVSYGTVAGRLEIYDTVTWAASEAVFGYDRPTRTLAWDHTGTRLVVLGDYLPQILRVVDAETLTEIYNREVITNSSFVLWDQQDNLVYNDNSGINVLDGTTAQPISSMPARVPANADAREYGNSVAAWSPFNGDILATGYTSELNLWSISTHTSLFFTQAGLVPYVITWSTHNRIALASIGGMIEVWEVPHSENNP